MSRRPASKKRDGSAKRNAHGSIDPLYDRREAFRRVLRSLDLDGHFFALPRHIQEQFYRAKQPVMTIEFDPAVQSDNSAAALREAVNRLVREATIELGGHTLRATEALSVFTTCEWLVRGASVERLAAQVAEDPSIFRDAMNLARFATFVRPALDELLSNSAMPLIHPIWHGLHTATSARGRHDHRLYVAQLEMRETPHGKLRPTVVVSSVVPERVDISIDGKRRPMYRVGSAGACNGVNWLTWQSGNEAERGGPIYVQAHALHRLRERVNLSGLGPYLETWMAEALNKPVVVERQGDDRLVEFRIHDDRIGYLVVTPIGADRSFRSGVAVRSFLFLTMEGTPEARKLSKVLRLARREVEWLGLADLTTFTRSDLRDDDELRELFERCGCGHLFDLDEAHPNPTPMAAELRRYLKMPQVMAEAA